MSQAVLRIVKAPNQWRCECGNPIEPTQECAKMGSRILCLECLMAGLPPRPAPRPLTKARPAPRPRPETTQTIITVDGDIWTLHWHHTDKEYQDWLEQQHSPKLKYGSNDHTPDYPQYKWMAEEEDLQNRRQGNMIYQRGKQ